MRCDASYAENNVSVADASRVSLKRPGSPAWQATGWQPRLIFLFVFVFVELTEWSEWLVVVSGAVRERQESSVRAQEDEEEIHSWDKTAATCDAGEDTSHDSSLSVHR